MAKRLVDVREPVNALFYGEGKTGKTTALAAMANLGRVLLVNAESGILRRPLEELGIAVENIEVYPNPGEPITHEGLEKQWFRVREDLHKDPDSWAGFGIDSVTELQTALRDETVRDDIDRVERLGRSRSRWIASQDDWQQTNSKLRDLIRGLRDLPCHFGMTALDRRETDNDGRVVYRPSVTPSMQNDLNLWVSVICWTSMSVVGGEEEYLGLFRPDGKYRGGDRTKSLPKYLPNPQFDRIVAYADRDLTVDSDPLIAEAKRRRADAVAEEEEKQPEEVAA